MYGDDRDYFDPSSISDWFWGVIFKANKNEELLRTLLLGLTIEEIYQFQEEFLLACNSLKGDIFLEYINDDESEDGIADITRWVVSQGKDYYMSVWENPEKIPSESDSSTPGILYGIAREVYEEKGGKGLFPY